MKGWRTKKSAKNRRQSGDMKLCKYQIKRIENKFLKIVQKLDSGTQDMLPDLPPKSTMSDSPFKPLTEKQIGRSVF